MAKRRERARTESGQLTCGQGDGHATIASVTTFLGTVSHCVHLDRRAKGDIVGLFFSSSNRVARRHHHSSVSFVFSSFFKIVSSPIVSFSPPNATRTQRISIETTTTFTSQWSHFRVYQWKSFIGSSAKLMQKHSSFRCQMFVTDFEQWLTPTTDTL